MPRTISLEVGLNKFVTGATDLLDALENCNEEELELFNENYCFPEDFYEVVSKMQTMETEFLTAFREKHSKKGYAICRSDVRGFERGWCYEIEYFEVGYDVLLRNTMIHGEHVPSEELPWDKFEEHFVAIPAEVYEAVEHMNYACLDTSRTAKEIITRFGDGDSFHLPGI